MHRVFAEAKCKEDIYLSIEQMVRDAAISPAEGKRLQNEVDKALENPTIAEWFSDEWSQVRNESEILVPHGEPVRRPDRVMIKGRRVVVLDYKFGEREQDSHKQQVLDYMSLLSRIGYSTIEGYLWYVRLGKIVAVK